MNQEVKGNLARLLATEDLIVEHKKVDTASFNVQTRVLTLPLWEKASNVVYDLLVGHEVGHALYTPNVDWQKDYDIPHDFVNLVEDARIEKLIKRRYAGLNKTFFVGYKELYDMDFFDLKGQDIQSLNLADKVLLHTKIGNLLNIQFTDKEKEIVNLVENAETFEEVLEVSKILYEYCELLKEEDVEDECEEEDDDSEENSDGESQDGEEQKIVLNGAPTKEPEENQEGKKSLSQLVSDIINQEEKSSDQNSSAFSDQVANKYFGEEKEEEPKNSSSSVGGVKKSRTSIMDSLNESIKSLVDNSSNYPTQYVEIPDVNLDSIIVTNDKIHSLCDSHWNSIKTGATRTIALLNNADEEFFKFKNNSQKEVNYLVKEFECKKSADAYARASTSKTGVIDCGKLHSYKYSEDIFKKVTTFKDGKNHGLIFILDWSGSMTSVILDTIKQLYNLIWFCKKSSIPFEVYAFTNDWGRSKVPHFQAKAGLMYIDESFNMMNLFTSNVNTKTLEKQMINIFRICFSAQNHSAYLIPDQMYFSGTPLNESLVTVRKIIPKFQKENKLQKVHCVVLTDGEGAPMRVCDNYTRRDGTQYVGVRGCWGNVYLRDRTTGNTYHVEYGECKSTMAILRSLRDKFKDVSFIGIRILVREAKAFIRLYHPETFEINSEFSKLVSEWKKNRSFVIHNSGYHAYFGLSALALSNDDEFEVSEDASKIQIKSAFVKSLKSKKMNKKILNEFIKLVA